MPIAPETRIKRRLLGSEMSAVTTDGMTFETRYRAHAKKLDRALSEVERLLASAPGALAWFLFNPLPPLTLAEEGESVEVMQSIENIELAYRARADSFGVELKRLRNVCARAVDPGFATHPNYGHAKHLTGLQSLDRGYTRVSDLGPLAQLTGLQSLVLPAA